MNQSKLKSKDIITVVLMSLINIFIFGFSTFLYLNPFTILLMPVYFALTQGIVFFMLGVKVPKKGAILLYCFIQGAITFNIPYILCYVISGIIAEFLLKKTGYADIRSLTLSYVIIQLFNCIGSTIYPYAITLKATLERMPEDGGVNSAYIEEAGHMIQSWGSIVLILVVIVSALIGAAFGAKIMKKHLLKAK